MGSPTRGQPMPDKCARIWCVRPVRGKASNSTTLPSPPKLSRTSYSVLASATGIVHDICWNAINAVLFRLKVRLAGLSLETSTRISVRISSLKLLSSTLASFPSRDHLVLMTCKATTHKIEVYNAMSMYCIHWTLLFLNGGWVIDDPILERLPFQTSRLRAVVWGDKLALSPRQELGKITTIDGGEGNPILE